MHVMHSFHLFFLQYCAICWPVCSIIAKFITNRNNQQDKLYYNYRLCSPFILSNACPSKNKKKGMKQKVLTKYSVYTMHSFFHVIKWVFSFSANLWSP
jgi:plasmid rolling circle replication initiator protein Rep